MLHRRSAIPLLSTRKSVRATHAGTNGMTRTTYKRLMKSDGMRRPVSGRDAVRSQVIAVLEAQIKRRPAMKKVSTVAAKASRKISQQKLTVGLDLGDRSSWYCVLDESGSIVLEQRVSTTSKALKEVFGGIPRSRMALETGMHSPWVSRLLSELGHEVIVAHAR